MKELDIISNILNNKKIKIDDKNSQQDDEFISNLDDLESLTEFFKIKVFGIGGAGCNAIKTMMEYRQWPKNVDIFGLNTDIGALRQLTVNDSIKPWLLAKSSLKGAGSGGNPLIGESAAKQDAESIRKWLKGTDLLFLIAGLGKGTGSGATPVIGKIAMELKIPTVCIVNIPSIGAEGQPVYENSLQSLNKIIENCNSLNIISNEKIISLSDNNFSLQTAYRQANLEISETISNFVNIINIPSETNIDFADIVTFINNAKTFNYISIEVEIEDYSRQNLANKINEALKLSYSYPYILNAKCAIVNLIGPINTPRSLLSDTRQILVELSKSNDMYVINGIATDENANKIKLDILIANGIDKSEITQKLNENINIYQTFDQQNNYDNGLINNESKENIFNFVKKLNDNKTSVNNQSFASIKTNVFKLNTKIHPTLKVDSKQIKEYTTTDPNDDD